MKKGPALPAAGVVAGQVKDGVVQPAFECRPVRRRVRRSPDTRKRFLQQLLGELSIMDKCHGETKSVVFQLPNQGFKPGAVARLQIVLPAWNFTRQNVRAAWTLQPT